MKKILVIQTASIGDVILATPVLEKLHNAFPESKIGILVKKGMESLFEGHPFLAEVLTWDKKKKFRSYVHLLRRIRKNRYDLVVNVQRFALTGLLTALSGAGQTAGFHRNPFSFLFTHRIKHLIGKGIHEAHRNLALTEPFTAPGYFAPKLYPVAGYQFPVASDQLPAVGALYYTVSPASLWFTKQFPEERWTELIRKMDPAAAVYLLGSSADTDLCERIAAASGHQGVKNLAGRLTFLESAALMKEARMNFTNDSAPMHLASSVDAPVTVIYCSTIPEFGFGPLSTDAVVVEIHEALSCRPCGLHGRKSCPENHFKCAWNISAEDLAKRL